MEPRISVGCISYFHSEQQIMHIVSSWLCQRDGRFDFTLIHDGPHPHMEEWLKKYSLGDPRFSYYAPPEREIDRLIRERPEEFQDPSFKRHGFWGHFLRKKHIEEMATGSQIHSTNADNSYAPLFVEAMLGLALSGNFDITLSNLVHSYQNPLGLGNPAYDIMRTQPVCGHSDFCNYIVKTEFARKVGFNNGHHIAADGFFLNDLMAAGARWGHTGMCLSTHN